MELLWLLALILVPLAFVTPGVMSNGYDLPKVTLYRSLVGLMGALWIVEWGLTARMSRGYLHTVSWVHLREWAFGHPTRWVLVGAGLVLASNLISTVLSPSVTVSLWGSEPALDGYGLYNTLSHFILFAVLASHLKTMTQLWRLLAAIVASGVVVGLYGILQFYALDPFGVHAGGIRVISSLGNPIFAAAFLLMVVPVTLAMAVKRHESTVSPALIVPWVAVLAVPLLAIAFTQARGPWVGLAAALIGFLALVSMALGWRATVRAGTLLAASLVITLVVITFAPTPSGHPDDPTTPALLAFRALSITPEVFRALTADITPEVFRALTADTLGRESEDESQRRVSAASGMKTRLLIWQGARRLVLRRPWFEFDDRPFPLSLYAFGYGPEFFQYLFPLERPLELVNPHRDTYLQFALAAHNDLLHRTVELGFFGIASYLFLLGSLIATGVSLVMGKLAALDPSHKLAMAAVLASIGGRVLEQMVGIPHLADVALFWALLAVVVALPRVTGSQDQQNGEFAERGIKNETLSRGRWSVVSAVSRLSLALILASLVVALTIMKNPSYALAEKKSAAAAFMLKKGDLPMAMRQIDDAIALAPDVGRFHVTRAKILDTARKSALGQKGTSLMAQEAYSTNQRAVAANPFDTYSRLYFAESALTLAGLEQDGMGDEAIGEYKRLTQMVPSHWLTHFLLARAYMEQGLPEHAIKAYDEAVRLNPQYLWMYSQRGMAYVNLGQYQRAIEDFDTAIRPGGSATYFSQRGVAFYGLGQLKKAIEDFDEAIKRDPKLASAYNNRGTAYHELGQLERAVEDFDEAIRLNPQFAEAYANRALAYSVQKRYAEAQQDVERAVELGFSLESQEVDFDIAKDRR